MTSGITIKRVFMAITLLLTCLTFNSCVTNNGDIGFLYGIWDLKAVEIDGVEQSSWNDDDSFTTFSFQNNIVMVKRNLPNHEAPYVVGTFVNDESDAVITFDFTHSDDDNGSGQGLYAAPGWIYFPQGVTAMTYSRPSDKDMVLTAALADGRRLTYYLNKEY